MSVELSDVVFCRLWKVSNSISTNVLHSILVDNICFESLLGSWAAFHSIVSNKHYFYIFLLLITSKLVWVCLLESILTWSIHNSVILYLLYCWMSLNFRRFLIVKACISYWISNSRWAAYYFRIQKLIRVLIRVPQFFIHVSMTCSLRLLSIWNIGDNTPNISVWLRHCWNPRGTTKIHHLIRQLAAIICQKVSMTSGAYIIKHGRCILISNSWLSG